MEGLKEDTKTLGDATYLVRQLPGKEARRVLARFLQMKERGDSMTPDEMDYFCDTFAKYTDVVADGKGQILANIFDLHFRGKMKQMMEWLGFAFEVNFSDFLLGPGVTSPPASPATPAST